MVKNRRHDIVKPSKYKTSVCSFYLSEEGCPFGDNCAFAHGLNEVRCEVENTKKPSIMEKVDDARVGDAGTLCSSAADEAVPFKSDSSDCIASGVPNPTLVSSSAAKMSEKQVSLQPGSSAEKGSVRLKEDRTQEEVVGTIDEIKGKRVKRQLKLKMGSRADSGRKGNVNAKTKIRDPINNNTREDLSFKNAQCRGAPRYSGSDVTGGKGVLEATNNSLTLPVFSPLPPGTVLLPYSGCLPSFVPQGTAALSVPFGSVQMTGFGSTTGTPAFAAPTTKNDFSLHYPYVGFPMPAFQEHVATVSRSDHDEQQTSSQPSFMDPMPSSSQPTLNQNPNTAMPLSHNFIWPHHSDRVMPQMVPDSVKVVSGTQDGNFCEQEDLVTDDTEAHDEGQFVTADWNAAIEKWLKNEKENLSTEPESEARCGSKGVYSLSLEGCSHAKDMLSTSLCASRNDTLKTFTEEYLSIETKKKATECDESFTTGLLERKEVSLAKSCMDMYNGKASFGCIGIQENKKSTEDVIYNDRKHTTPTSTQERILSFQGCTSNIITHSIPNDVRKSRPIMSNEFHSTCKAAGQSAFLYHNEKNIVPQLAKTELVEKGRKMTAGSASGEVCKFESPECYYDYCI